MAEPTLSAAYNDIAGEVGSFLGYGRGAALGDTTWNRQQQQVIDSCVKSGLRQFYYPPTVDNSGMTHAWSFLRPTYTADLLISTNTLRLPDDFGGFEGNITLVGTSNQTWFPIQLVNEGDIRAKFSEFPAMVSRPLIAALQPLKGTGQNAGQRFQLYFFPTSDATYSIQFTYYINPDYLSGALPYAYGGAQHVETIIESCLAIAERRLDDEEGVHAKQFKERLVASIGMDKASKPQHLGYNSDNSDKAGWSRFWNHYGDTIRINGVAY